jgi:Spy/CpxP family protein refolding chaperone
MSGNGKLVIAVGFFLGAACVFYMRYRHVRPAKDALVPRQTTGSTASEPGGVETIQLSPGGPAFRLPSREERHKMRWEILDGLDLSAEQRAKMEAIEKQYDDSKDPMAWRQRMQEMSDVLTPEQRDQAYDSIRKQVQAHARERIQALPPDQQEKFMKKLRERMEQIRRKVHGQTPRQSAAQSPPTATQ